MAKATATIGKPAAWSDQDILLYHGTTDGFASAIVATGISLARCRTATDFGRGFYTTTNLDQAWDWARSTSLRIVGSTPGVIRFNVSRDKLASLESIWFVRGDRSADDYWSLVCHCRSGGADHARGLRNGWYDLAIGPLASSWRRRTIARSDGDQIGFHTRRAVTMLGGSPKQVIAVP